MLVLLGFRCWTGAIWDYDDDDASNHFGEGESRVLSAFRDLYESLGSRYGNGGFGHVSVSNSNLISISAQAKIVKIDNNLGMKKSSIDDKQYLDIYASSDGSCASFEWCW